MKKTVILGFLTAGLAFGSFTASAASDDQYPAANFQPKVVFIDKEAAAAASSSSASESVKCPGQSQAAAAKQTEFDPKYPAASFEPKVVYPN
jgi:flagellar basal body rod protein FlgC